MRKPSEHLTRLVSFGIGKYTLFLEVGKKHVKRHVKKVVEHYPKAIALALVVALIFSQTVYVPSTYAATYNFTQSNWAGGATATQAGHGSNQTGWTQYSAKTATTSIANAGEDVQISNTVASVTQTTATEFTDATRTNVVITGSGSSGTMQLATTSTADTWATLDVVPGAVGDGSGMVRNGDYIYVTQGGNATGFYRYSVTNGTWSTLTAVPSAVGGGGTIVSYGSHVYVARGNYQGGFWRYDVDNPGWSSALTAPPNTNIDHGLMTMITNGTDGYIYAGIGGGTNFYRFTVGNPGSWSNLSTPPAFSGHAKLLHNGSEDAIYLMSAGYSTGFYRYLISNPGAGWTALSATANFNYHGAQMVRNGSDDYIYVTPGYGATNFQRYSISAGTTWTTLATLPAALDDGSSMIADSSYIYAIRGGNTGSFYKYTIPVSGTGSWAPLQSVPGGALIGNGSALLRTGIESDVYLTQGNGGTGFYKYSLITAYKSTGTATSTVIDMGQTSVPSTLSYTANAPSGTSVTFDVRAGDVATPDGTWTSWVTGVANGGDISSLIGYQYLQYRVNFTSDTLDTPTVSDVTLNFSNYTNTFLVTLTGSKYDTTSAGNLISKVTWTSSGTSASELMKIQVKSASSAAGLDSAEWCGYADTGTCTGSNYFLQAHNGVAFASDNPLRTGGDDQYLQYKVTLTSGGTATPVLSSLSIQYVVNAAPNFDTTYGSAGTGASSTPVTIEGADWGKVGISYKIRDTDTTTGTTNAGYITPSFEYSINGGSSYADITSGYLGASDLTNKVVEETNYNTYSATWNANGQLGSNTYVTNAKIRVKANDNEAALSTATAASANFTLDTKSPAVSAFTIDASSATSTLHISATDNSNILDYILSNNSDVSADGLNATSGIAQATSSTSLLLDTLWTLTGTTSVTAYLRTRDIYGNTSTTTASAPIAPANVEIKDVSSPDINTYREFITWTPFTAASGVVFSKYQLYRSTDDSTYSLFTEIADSAVNYYADSSVASTTTYYYKVRSVDADGDISNYGTTVNDLPDGQGGSDTVAPTLTNVSVGSVGNTSATVTWNTDELSTSAVEFGTSSSYGSTSSNSSYVVTGHSISLTGLTPNTLYYYQPKSTDISSNVGTGSGGTFTTSGGPVISGVTVVNATEKQVTVQWDTNTAADSYVNYSPSSNLGSYTTVGSATPVSSPFQHQVTITGLTAGTTYYYQVKSTDAAANTTTDNNLGSYYSFTTTSDTTAPVISNIIVPVKSESSAVIVWTTDELSTSQVEFGATASTTSGNYASTTAMDSVRTINHVTSLTGLSASTPYYFRAKSKDSANNTATSDEDTFTSADAGTVTIITTGGGGGGSSSTPKDTTPPVITNITAKSVRSFDAEITLAVSEPSYVLLNYGESSSYGQTAASTALSQSHAIALTGMKPGTTYYYQATVIDGAGNTAQSQQGTFKTLFLAESLQNLTLLKNAQDYQDMLQDIIESALPSILPPFIESPTVSSTTEDTATITYRTGIKSFGIVSYATDDAFKETQVYGTDIAVDKEKTTSHVVTLTGLTPNTKYHAIAKAFVFPEVVGSSPDIAFSTKAAQVAATILNVTTDSFRAVWKTIIPATAIIKYTNTVTGVTQEKTSAKLETEHDMEIDGLTPRTTYLVTISGNTAGGNEISAKETFTVKTIVDVAAPAITELKISSALTSGQTNSVQTIVSWKTSEPSTSNVSYEEGSGAPNAVLTNKAPDTQGLVQNHIVILTNLKQATIYRVQVASTDAASNTAALPVTTIITPKQSESIVDVIFKNFGTTFSFIK